MSMIEMRCCHYLHYYVVWLVVGVLDDGVVPSIAKFVVGFFLIVVMLYGVVLQFFLFSINLFLHF